MSEKGVLLAIFIMFEIVSIALPVYLSTDQGIHLQFSRDTNRRDDIRPTELSGRVCNPLLLYSFYTQKLGHL